MSFVVGYLRNDRDEQGLESQRERLMSAGVNKIYQEQPSARPGRTPQLDKLLAEARQGDTLVVTSLDRIAHNTRHLLEIVESLHAAGVTFKALDSGIDTSTAHGDVMRLLLGAIVDFERQVVRERQAAGIAIARREGRYKGRKPTARAKADEVLALNARGLTRQKIADELGIGVASVYRILKAQAKPKIKRKKVTKEPEPAAVKKPQKVARKPKREADAEQLSFF